MKQDEEQQEPVCVCMASLSLGPALKAQFAASSKRFTSLGDGCARNNLPAKPSMDEDENKHHGNDDPSPAGRRRPRKGILKQSPFDDDSWNDELADSV
eukprot:2778146-Rhodomonas_salina.1